ncbi:SAM-dependent chlorinase/fluorinase [Candidatus Woesearchaeota archaeon]|nr:SAM-dependent chlorinase/fluorinase [Candidatus Woesearchaeota archaeon]
MIAILSDFGHSEYLGVMKGVIRKTYPEAQITDLYNDVKAQNILEGAWILLKSYSHFPKGTVFLAVVDPGVGGKRNPIAIKTKDYYFVGPDNGLMYPAASDNGITKVIKLSDKGASKTFQGRDVFAGIAARIAKGERFEKLGHAVKLQNKLDFRPKGREGKIVRVDTFGNIITNLSPLKKKEYQLQYEHRDEKIPYFESYEAASPDQLFVITGSADTLEIALKNGSAFDNLPVKIGDKIVIK